jgi:hypothetical protein
MAAQTTASKGDTMRDYTSWIKESTEQEHVDGQNASYERWLGKQMSKAAISHYNEAFQSDHGHELTTRQSARQFANELAYAPEGKA